MANHYTTLAICSPGHEFNCEEFNEQHANTNLCAVVRPMPDAIEQEWAIEHWGTKWGTYGVRAFELGGDGAPILIKFQSANSPPKILCEIASWLRRVGGFERVVFIGFDPYDDTVIQLTHEAG